MAKNCITNSKHREKRIEEVAAYVNSIIAAAPTIKGIDDYINTYRSVLNIKLIELCLGVTYTERTSKNGVKAFLAMNAKPADATQLMKIASILTPFLEWEQNLLAINPDWVNDSMAVNIDGHISIGELEKVSQKAIKEYCMSAVKAFLDNGNLIELSAAGDKIRKHREMIKWIIIGGATALLLGGGITAICIGASHSKDDTEEVEESDDNDDIDEDIDLPEVDGPDDIDDTPVVVAGFCRW